ncbi:MAG TPA: hypothetical protein VFY20_14280 [Gemmatimonadales bacterium]|nr:hypothetical protein [Gemmatimonadales bacterium]
MSGRIQNALQVIAALVVVGWGVSACADSATDEQSRDLAAARPATGGSGTGGKVADVKVSAVDPDTVAADTTLDIRVLGSGFTPGSQVAWALKGSTTTKVTTSGPVRFVSASELVAPVTVAADADLTVYDVTVTTSGGKKGIGVEMLLVVASMTALPEPPGISESFATDVADNGVIVGYGSDGTRSTALRWTPNGDSWTVETLGDGSARAINDAGYVLMHRKDGATGRWHNWVRAPGGSETRFDAQDWIEDISNAGTLIGWRRFSDTTGVAVVWRMSGSGWAEPITFLPPAGYESVWFNAIGDRDDIAGRAVPSSAPTKEQAVLWLAGGTTWGPMSLVDASDYGAALTINNRGAVAGAHWPCLDSSCASKPAFWAAVGAPLQILATPVYSTSQTSRVEDMNNAGQIAGSGWIQLSKRGGGSVKHALVWQTPGDPAPLDIGAGKGAVSSEATAINDARLVVGTTYGGNVHHAVVWRLP